MVGITLSPEQIRSAPPEVRRWLEGEIAATLGLRPHGPEELPPAGRLTSLSVEEAGRVLAAVQGMLPVASVFFELGRTGEGKGPEGLAVLPLIKILTHTRMAQMDQVLACLQVINEACRKVKQDPSANVCLLDRRGFCIVSETTQESIQQLWQELASRHAPAGEGAEPSSLAMSGAVPTSGVHMGQFR